MPSTPPPAPAPVQLLPEGARVIYTNRDGQHEMGQVERGHLDPAAPGGAMYRVDLGGRDHLTCVPASTLVRRPDAYVVRWHDEDVTQVWKLRDLVHTLHAEAHGMEGEWFDLHVWRADANGYVPVVVVQERHATGDDDYAGVDVLVKLQDGTVIDIGHYAVDLRA